MFVSTMLAKLLASYFHKQACFDEMRNTLKQIHLSASEGARYGEGRGRRGGGGARGGGGYSPEGLG